MTVRGVRVERVVVVARAGPERPKPGQVDRLDGQPVAQQPGEIGPVDRRAAQPVHEQRGLGVAATAPAWCGRRAPARRRRRCARATSATPSSGGSGASDSRRSVRRERVGLRRRIR